MSQLFVIRCSHDSKFKLIPDFSKLLSAQLIGQIYTSLHHNKLREMRFPTATMFKGTNRHPRKIQPLMSFKSEPTFVDFAPRNHPDKSHDHARNVQKPQTRVRNLVADDALTPMDTNREYCLERGENIFALLEKNCVL